MLLLKHSSGIHDYRPIKTLKFFELRFIFYQLHLS